MNQSKSTTRVLTFQRKDGSCYSCSRNSRDLRRWGSQADPQLDAWAKQVGKEGAAMDNTLIDDHSIIVELPPEQVLVKDRVTTPTGMSGLVKRTAYCTRRLWVPRALCDSQHGLSQQLRELVALAGGVTTTAATGCDRQDTVEDVLVLEFSAFRADVGTALKAKIEALANDMIIGYGEDSVLYDVGDGATLLSRD